MSDAPRIDDSPDIPEAAAAAPSRWSFQLVWLIPLVALLVGGWLAAKAILERGPTITMSFKTAEGLEAGKTKLRYKDVEVGIVRSVALSEDRTRVIATAELVKSAEGYLVEDTRMWVVRPRISGGTVSGIGTLLSGSYIGIDIGQSAKRQKDFVGLEAPPVVTIDVPGRQYVLKSVDIGSLDVGSPVYFRRLQVGQVTAYELDPDGSSVTLKVFVHAPYDRYVTGNTRFWHASGIDVSLDAQGVKLKTESLVSIALGGLAFGAPPDAQPLPAADALSVFALYPDHAQAMKHPDRISDTFVMVFKQSVRGLSVGAPVDFRGIVVGEVARIDTHFDPATKEFSIPVEVRFFPERLSRRLRGDKKGGRIVADPQGLMIALIERGLRAQLRTGNLITGQLYVMVDIFPGTAKVKIDRSQTPMEIPTIPSPIEDLQATVANIAKKLEKLPLDQIGSELVQTLKGVDQLVKRFDAEVAPQARDALAEARSTLAEARTTVVDLRTTLVEANKAIAAAERAIAPDAPLTQDARDALRELSRAAQTLRALADYLERHPQALLTGKREDGK